MPRRSRTLLSAKMLRASSSTSSTVLPTRSSSELCSRSSMRCLSGGQVGDDPVQEQRGFVEQPLRQFDALDDDAARHRVQLRILLGRQLAAGEHDDRQVGQRRVVADRFEQLEARHVGQPQIEHDAIDRLRRAVSRAPRRRCRPVTMSMSSWPSSSRDAELLGRIVLDDQQALAARLDEILDPAERRLEILGWSTAW